MKSLLVVVLLLGVTFGQITINYKSDANVSLSNLNDFKFRATSLGTFSVPTLYNGAFVSSLSIDINQGSATIDAVHGAAYTGVNFNPAAYLAYFSSASFWTGVTNYLAANVSAAAGFVGNSYLLLEEVNEESVLQEINLRDLLWTQESANAGNGGLRYVTFKGSQLLINPNFKVYLTFTISDVVGVIQVGAGEAIVTPKTLESIVQIQNFPYQNTANSVRLTLGVATAAATLQATGQFNHYVAGSGLNGAYFSLSNQAVYGAEVAPVQIGAFVSGSADVAFGTNADLVAQVQSVYKAAAQFSIVTVTFKSGANDIVYDPTLGVGSNPPEESSTSIIAPLVFMLFILVSLF